jgi:hypothetical protein
MANARNLRKFRRSQQYLPHFSSTECEKKNNGSISLMTIEKESKNFKIETNEQPPSLNISWYDQKEIFAPQRFL